MNGKRHWIRRGQSGSLSVYPCCAGSSWRSSKHFCSYCNSFISSWKYWGWTLVCSLISLKVICLHKRSSALSVGPHTWPMIRVFGHYVICWASYASWSYPSVSSEPRCAIRKTLSYRISIRGKRLSAFAWGVISSMCCPASWHYWLTPKPPFFSTSSTSSHA